MFTASRCLALLLTFIAVVSDGRLVAVVGAQDPPALFESAGPSEPGQRRGQITPRRDKRVRGRVASLDAPAVRFNLFDVVFFVERGLGVSERRGNRQRDGNNRLFRQHGSHAECQPRRGRPKCQPQPRDRTQEEGGE